jgi:hypothetical protein
MSDSLNDKGDFDHVSVTFNNNNGEARKYTAAQSLPDDLRYIRKLICK